MFVLSFVCLFFFLRRSPASPFIPSGVRDSLGEIAITRSGAPPAVRTLSPAQAGSLCGERLQWIEIVR